ncbi:uncharacterized protein KY384_003642, partial [Bacidia gigantensis]|uniref:uncharacterized protein n=1 Tax=Bacidia gigantensis TaxID=2732470 RepID=UPI001D03EFCB
MAKPRPGIPTNWEEYEYGRSPRQGSTGSMGSHVQFDTTPTGAGPHDFLNPERPSHGGAQSADGLRRQTSRSSISTRFNSLTHAGGVNSFENFARSWSRAAGFAEIPQRKPSFVVSEDEEESLGSKRSGKLPSPAESRSLLRQQLEQQQGNVSESAIDEASAPLKQGDETNTPLSVSHSSLRSNNFLERTPHLISPFSSSHGGVYGSLPSRSNESLIRRSLINHYDQPEDESKMLEQEQEPLLIKILEHKDGKRIQIVVGQSTLPQTVFNSVNVLIGVGLLSLPLGLKQSGWLIGMIFLMLAALVTRHTARLLAKCLDLDHSLVTFSDIAWKAFGSKARIAVGLLFSVELLAACVALVVLFADSLNALIPGWQIVGWK